MRDLRGLVLALLLPGCTALAIAGGAIPPPGDGMREPHRIGPPRGDRCAAQGGGQRKRCETMRTEAQRFMGRLSVDDQVCLEGNPLLDGVTSSCTVRAFVEDTAPNTVKLEIREAAHGSKYILMDDYWFHEAALVDLQLKQSGF